jgi:hypothetical protein
LDRAQHRIGQWSLAVLLTGDCYDLASAYVSFLRRIGIEMAIPSTRKFILVNIPS